MRVSEGERQRMCERERVCDREYVTEYVRERSM